MEFLAGFVLSLLEVTVQAVAYARPIGLPAAREFTSLNRHYGRYWGSWRFWLLA